MDEQLKLDGVSVSYGNFTAVREVSLALLRGEIGCLLGPSGCGKTSLLRAIAGFEPVASGKIILRGQLLSAPGHVIVPEQRRVGMVFQDFALFPHLNLAANIGFGLAHLQRDEARSRIAAMLELVGMTGRDKTMPHELSGGQQQRVALARALAPGPDILLLDEPFSSLDTELREQLASEVRHLLKETDTTAILVSHDQHEAFAMADKVAVLASGEIAQFGSPAELYQQPADAFVARFIGRGSVIEARVGHNGQLENGLQNCALDKIAAQAGENLQLLIRPEDVTYCESSDLRLPVTARAFRGARNLYHLRLPDDQQLSCLTPSTVQLEIGELLPVTVEIKNKI